MLNVSNKIYYWNLLHQRVSLPVKVKVPKFKPMGCIKLFYRTQKSSFSRTTMEVAQIIEVTFLKVLRLCSILHTQFVACIDFFDKPID